MATDVQSSDAQQVIDEEQYYHDAQLGALWTASRTLIPVVAATFGGIYFAYFYLRSLNSNGLWDPHGATASKIIGLSVLLLVLAGTAFQLMAGRRLRRGFSTDFIVGTASNVLFLVLATGLQIWELTRLPFPPAASGYAGVFIAFAPIDALVIGLSAYWAFTLMMRAIRSYSFYRADGGIGVSAHRAAENFRANLDGFGAYSIFFALMSVLSWYLFYVLH
ncbi:hypothetical protein [Ferrimicrobium sp.]|uniref:hypothetical protein n=1 Tax=Ferrimicrobium sp. TaxID=2926050 RepID=UPI00260F92FA|nr:hypothetical protein [Ferrimicrobium sp.]